MLADTHCHLDFNSFDEDREQVLARSWQAGLDKILNPGIDLSSSQAAVRLAEGHERVYAAIGVHPNEAHTWNDDSLARLRELADSPKVVAIGEIGLDYYRDRSPADLQKHILKEQLQLAVELNLPVIIHNRKATRDILEILGGWQVQLAEAGLPLAERPGVLHSYSDAEKPALQAIAKHFYIGLTGPVTFHNAPELQQVVILLPLDHVLVETDAPFLAPHPYRGRRNEPAYVRLVVEKIADLQQMDFSSVARITTANAARLFLW